MSYYIAIVNGCEEELDVPCISYISSVASFSNTFNFPKEDALYFKTREDAADFVKLYVDVYESNDRLSIRETDIPYTEEYNHKANAALHKLLEYEDELIKRRYFNEKRKSCK